MTYFDFVGGDRMYAEPMVELLGAPPRPPGSPLEPFHLDVARSVQVVLEEILLAKVDYLAQRVDSPNLCLAGGVALNCVANGRIARESPFERMFVQPAAGDAGGCLGAAALAHVAETGRRHTTAPMTRVDLGPHFSPDDVAALLDCTPLPYHDYRDREADLVDAVAARLERGEVVGWFQGAMEFGPRALGQRSILANPMGPTVRDRVNAQVKGREAFRPFAPSVLADHAAAHFDLPRAAPFMLETCRVTSPLGLPAITHVDGSARPQTVDPAAHPRYAALLEAFRGRTGCPLLLNTSLNLAGEPIVLSPVDALICFGRSGLDALVLGDAVVDRAAVPDNWSELLAAWDTVPGRAFGGGDSAISEHLYTFV
jgi:carbamoyltransferase